MPKSDLKFKEIQEFLKKIPRISAENAFPAFLILLFLALILGGLVFYEYGFLSQKIKPESSFEPVQFKENLYQKILAEWESRGERFEAAESKEYPDPFRP